LEVSYAKLFLHTNRDITLLKAFLETMDFGKLRSESDQYLIQGKRVKFVIYWKEDKPHYEVIIG